MAAIDPEPDEWKPGPSPLEQHARDVARAAADWAHEQTGGRTPLWKDLGWSGQATLAGSALTQIAISHGQNVVAYPEPTS